MKEVFSKHISNRNPPENIVPEDEAFFRHEFQREIPASYLQDLRSIHLLKDVLLGGPFFTLYSTYSPGQKLGKKAILQRLFLLRKRSIRLQKCVWIIDQWSLEYFHWLTDALPRLLASELGEPNLPIVLPEHYKERDYIPSSIELLNREVIFYSPSDHLFCERLLLPSHTAPTGNYNQILINQLRDRLTPSKTSSAQRKIYVSRMKADKRKILNEAEAMKVLRKYGYEIHHFEDYSFSQQIELLSESISLVGLHGAGLSNMLFMPKGGKVLELRNQEDGHNNCYFSLSSALGHRYFYLFCEGDSEDTHRVNINIDIQRLEELIQCLEDQPKR